MSGRSGPRDAAPAAGHPGQIVANFGRRVMLEDAVGERHQARPRGRRLQIVCGDRVEWAPIEGGGGVQVLRVLPRATVLERPDNRGRIEVLAANVTQVIAVAALKPEPDPFLIDRYLAAAALIPCAAGVVFNKIDLSERLPDILAELSKDLRAATGWLIKTSAKGGRGIDELTARLAGHTSILVGQSGVGKSSLLNALIPGLSAATDEISSATGLGKHTTSASMLHRLENGGCIIDSPGVRDYAPPPVEPRFVAHGFTEFADFMHQCRFADCLHMREPDCAVKAAVEAGTIAARRYESYRRLLRLMEKLRQGH